MSPSRHSVRAAAKRRALPLGGEVREDYAFDEQDEYGADL